MLSIRVSVMECCSSVIPYEGKIKLKDLCKIVTVSSSVVVSGSNLIM